MIKISALIFTAICITTCCCMSAVDAVNDKFAEGSESRNLMKIKGHVSAAFTPVNEKGDLDFSNLEKMM